MPKLSTRLTHAAARKLPPPSSGYEIFWCAGSGAGGLFGVRVGAPVRGRTSRAWILERRVDGKTKRVTLGKADGPAAISCDAARKLALTISSELQAGIDRAAAARERRKREEIEAITLAEAVREYVQKKRRTKDGLPLKPRTQADYLAAVEPGRQLENGNVTNAGELHMIAHKSIHHITGADIRRVYEDAAKRSERQAAYALSVLRAVLNCHGVQVPDNPLGKDVAGRDRIVLPGPKAKGLPIPPERIGAWWRAACAAGREEVGGSREAADALRFMLLTGARPGETLGAEHVEGILARDVDLVGGRVVLRDTKNRKDHTVLLSRQALAIVERNAAGKALTERLFSVGDLRKTLRAVNATAGVKVTPHCLRKTFATVADEIVPGYAVKQMINHADPRDVTGTHYIRKGEASLRLAWQAVADYIETQAGVEPQEPAVNVVQLTAREVA